MKIVLINPPSPFEKEPAMNPPLGLCYLSAYVKMAGYDDVRMVDYSLYPFDQGYLKQIPLDAEMYGITCVTPQYWFLYEISEYIKLHNPDGCIVAGGPHPTNCAEECLADCKIDYVVKGEGEFAFLQIVLMKDRDEKSFLPWLVRDSLPRDISPIIQWDYNKYLDDLPFPDRNLVPMSEYKRTIKNKPAIHMITLRGCSYACHYCDQSRGRRIRYRSIKNVAEEMDQVKENYNIRAFIIYDDVFMMSHKRVRAFCQHARSKGYVWRCWTRADFIDWDLLVEMKESGLASITLGIESGDDDILENINKNISAIQNKRALHMLKDLEIPVRCSLMYGNPGETKRTLQNTVNLIAETQPDEWNLAVLTPVPGSAFWDRPEDFGLKFDKEWLHDQWYEPCNRFGSTGVGDPWIEIDTMTKKEFRENLAWLVSELERVCPRRQIQDTIQEIRV